MAEPTISIIVPVYKTEAYLKKCVDSILVQTFRDFELLLIDDGSPDNCPALCEEAAARDPRIRVIHQKNAGLSAARNTGVEAARGDWIGFVDSDDSIAPEMYETLLTYARRDGAQIAVCDYLLVTEAGEPLPSPYRLEEDKVLDCVGALEQMNRGRFTVAWNRLYRRELFETVRFPVGKIHEDEYTAHQFYWQCERITIAAKPLYFYVQRGGSIIHTDSPQKTMDLAEGIFLRACFEQEQQLTRLAIEAAKTSMLVFAQAHRRKDLQPAQRQWCTEMRGRMNALAKTLLKSGNGSRADRIKFRLFLCSPTLYRAALLTKSWMNKIGF